MMHTTIGMNKSRSVGWSVSCSALDLPTGLRRRGGGGEGAPEELISAGFAMGGSSGKFDSSSLACDLILPVVVGTLLFAVTAFL